MSMHSRGVLITLHVVGGLSFHNGFNSTTVTLMVKLSFQNCVSNCVIVSIAEE